MSKIVEVHRKVDNNVGDYYCNPSRYFDINCNSEELMYNESNLQDKILIVGGGGLIHKKFSQHIQALIDKQPKHTILWGIGHNFGKKYVQKSDTNAFYPKWLDQCSLVGIRDYIEGHYDTYLPCVSCMHNAFDKQYTEKHEYVYFTHAYKSKVEKVDYPMIKNNLMDFNKVIEFLGSGNTVITDSYHGAYWAQLLGKNVQVVSWSVKFNHMKHAPHFIDNINTQPVKVNNAVNGFLEECRDLNQSFYQKFKNL